MTFPEIKSEVGVFVNRDYLESKFETHQDASNEISHVKIERFGKNLQFSHGISHSKRLDDISKI